MATIGDTGFPSPPSTTKTLNGRPTATQPPDLDLGTPQHKPAVVAVNEPWPLSREESRSPDAASPGSFDLRPPPPRVSMANIEDLSVLFFSTQHLAGILKDRKHSNELLRFLEQYRPDVLPLLRNYVAAQKSLLSVEYANSLIQPLDLSPFVATAATKGVKAYAESAIRDLASEALPAFLTHKLVRVVTETLVKEVTGQSSPLTRGLIPSLAEVYCISDPSLPDNPIVYASEEFYRVSQYASDYTIGRNCRFLQGPKTATRSVRRLVDAIKAGQETSETILNYRRDGTAFLNLLMIAPLYDNRGAVRYYIGAQIDVSSLVERGRTLDSFEQLLKNEEDRVDSRMGSHAQRASNDILADLGVLLDAEETRTLKSSISPTRNGDLHITEGRTATKHRLARRIIGMDEDDDVSDTASHRSTVIWPEQSLGPSGRLPGVYQNYLLVRPYPSLRITFTSPALRIPGLVQTKLMDRVGGSEHVREGLVDALANGVSVTAKVQWLTTIAKEGVRPGVGRSRWLHCTPLTGSDDKIGVWMIVMVENEEVTGRLNRSSVREPVSRPGTAADSDRLYHEHLSGQLTDMSRSGSTRR